MIDVQQEKDKKINELQRKFIWDTVLICSAICNIEYSSLFLPRVFWGISEYSL